MLNPLQTNSEPFGQKNETGENSKEPIKKCYFLKQKYFIIIDYLKINKVGSGDGDLNFWQKLTVGGCIILPP